MIVCHLTSVHGRRDTRVVLKECLGLAENGYKVYLVVADGKGDESYEDIEILDAGKPRNRLVRILFYPGKILAKALNTRARIYHFHDPELIFSGIVLRMLGKRVIFDVHEDFIGQVRDKPYLPDLLGIILIPLLRLVNLLASKSFFLILAETSYLKIYQGLTRNAETVLNTYKPGLLDPYIVEKRPSNEIFYIGQVTVQRGAVAMMEAMRILRRDNIDFRLHLVGTVNPPWLLEEYGDIRDRLSVHGKLDVRKGYEISTRCAVGLAVLLPTRYNQRINPTKIFEYMSVQMPVIASNFPLYENIVKDNDCGLCVDPDKPQELAEAILFVFRNRKRAREMGRNGRAAVLQKYNWKAEERKLVDVYEKLIN